MLMDEYFKGMKEVLDKIETTQRSAIIESSKAIANSLVQNGMWHILDTGHMLMYEGVGRTGGMMALRPIRINCDVTNPTRHRLIEGKQNVYYDMIEGFPEFILGKANLRTKDVLMIGSVSGYNVLPVELALKAKEMGVITIAITAIEYSRELTSKHPSGKRLFEVCDYVLDNCTNQGDTLVDVKPIEKRICPASGIGAAYLMWALQSTVIETLISMGKEPSVYISNHMPNASQINNSMWENYEKYGY